MSDRYSHPPLWFLGEQTMFDDGPLFDQLGNSATHIFHLTLQSISPIAFRQESVTAQRSIRAASFIASSARLRSLVLQGQHPTLFHYLAERVSTGSRWMSLDQLDLRNQPFRIPDAELASAISSIVSATPHLRLLRVSPNEHFAPSPPPGLQRLIIRQNDLFTSFALQNPQILQHVSHMTVETGVILRPSSAYVDVLADRLVGLALCLSTLRLLVIPLSSNIALQGAFEALSSLPTLRVLVFTIRSTDAEGGDLILSTLSATTPCLRTVAFFSYHTPNQPRGPLPEFVPRAVGAVLDADGLRGLRKIFVVARRSPDSAIHALPPLKDRANVRWLRHLSAPYRIAIHVADLSNYPDISRIVLE